METMAEHAARVERMSKDLAHLSIDVSEIFRDRVLKLYSDTYLLSIDMKAEVEAETAKMIELIKRM